MKTKLIQNSGNGSQKPKRLGLMQRARVMRNVKKILGQIVEEYKSGYYPKHEKFPEIVEQAKESEVLVFQLAKLIQHESNKDLIFCALQVLTAVALEQGDISCAIPILLEKDFGWDNHSVRYEKSKAMTLYYLNKNDFDSLRIFANSHGWDQGVMEIIETLVKKGKDVSELVPDFIAEIKNHPSSNNSYCARKALVTISRYGQDIIAAVEYIEDLFVKGFYEYPRGDDRGELFAALAMHYEKEGDHEQVKEIIDQIIGLADSVHKRLDLFHVFKDFSDELVLYYARRNEYNKIQELLDYGHEYLTDGVIRTLGALLASPENPHYTCFSSETYDILYKEVLRKKEVFEAKPIMDILMHLFIKHPEQRVADAVLLGLNYRDYDVSEVLDKCTKFPGILKAALKNLKTRKKALEVLGKAAQSEHTEVSDPASMILGKDLEENPVSEEISQKEIVEDFVRAVKTNLQLVEEQIGNVNQLLSNLEQMAEQGGEQLTQALLRVLGIKQQGEHNSKSNFHHLKENSQALVSSLTKVTEEPKEKP